MELVAARVTLLAPGGAFGRQGADVQALAKQVNTLEQ
jgi:hypothetical protein